MAGYKIINGTVYVPGSGKFEKKDLYIEDGKLQKSFPVHQENAKNLGQEYRVIDATGCYVTKGLIDYHVHYFEGGADNGVNPDVASFPNGVTTAVDGGSCGVSSFDIFKKAIIDKADVRLYAQLLMGSGGQLAERYPEHIEVEMIEEERIIQTFSRYPNELVGLKTRISANVIDPKDARASLEKSVSIAEKIGCNLTVHITNSAMDLEEIATILRKGDVICHAFQNLGKESILNADGNVRKGIWKARERGVIFDACNGKNNFNLKTAELALKQGFFPDLISSDVNACSYYEGVLHSLPKVLSKYLAMDQSLDRILDAAILKPAQVLGHAELASMDVGAPADLFIFKLEEHDIIYFDHTNGENTVHGNQMIVPQMTIKNGKVVYSQVYFES
ncbi:MAG: amidohydrolase family protein [Oliverpabstia sp.]